MAQGYPPMSAPLIGAEGHPCRGPPHNKKTKPGREFFSSRLRERGFFISTDKLCHQQQFAARQ